MANEEHLKILRQGVDAWNQWREKNSNLMPLLTGANLRGASLRHADLHDADLIDSDLGQADLRRANLTSVYLRGANLVGATLHGANLSNASLLQVNFVDANLVSANLSEANLAGASLSRTSLIRADLTRACLYDVNLKQADIIAANLTEAVLSRANFSESRIGSDSFTPKTLFNSVDLSQATDLGSAIHKAPSSIGIDTLALTLRGSGGRFTEEQLIFFENSGVPATLLEYLPSILEDNPLQFYACFISYSTRDEDFTEPLNQDLNAAGIKTWKWDRDAVRGRDLAQNIDLAIRTNDKTILVC